MTFEPKDLEGKYWIIYFVIILLAYIQRELYRNPEQA